MRCLTDIEVQAVVDGEASDELRAHADACEACRTRVDERRDQMETIASLIDADGMPSAALESRLRHAMRDVGNVRGATVLRARRPSAWRNVGLVSAPATAAATAAVIALVVYGVLPRLGAPTTLSASEVCLDRCNDLERPGRRAARIRSGDGRHDGWPSGHPPGHRSRQPASLQGRLVSPGRDDCHSDQSGPGATAAVAALSRRRHQLHRPSRRHSHAGAVDPADGTGTGRDQHRHHAGKIRSATDDRRRSEWTAIHRGDSTGDAAESTATLDLFSARAVISGTDFRIQEFTATGTMLRQPFSVSVKLRTHEYIGGAATDESLRITPGPDDIVLEGQADEDPVTELMTTVLRELGRARGN